MQPSLFDKSPHEPAHIACYDDSDRLQRALAALQAHATGLTTVEWQREARVANASTTAFELRGNGWDVQATPARVTGSRVHIYYLRTQDRQAGRVPVARRTA